MRCVRNAAFGDTRTRRTIAASAGGAGVTGTSARWGRRRPRSTPEPTVAPASPPSSATLCIAAPVPFRDMAQWLRQQQQYVCRNVLIVGHPGQLIAPGVL